MRIQRDYKAFFRFAKNHDSLRIEPGVGKLTLFWLTISMFIFSCGLFILIVVSAANQASNDSMQEVYASEPSIFKNNFDDWSMCAESLTFSGYDEEKSLIWNSAMAPTLFTEDGPHPCVVLEGIANNTHESSDYFSYSRYWHGSGSVMILISKTFGMSNFKAFVTLGTLFSLIFFASMWRSRFLQSAPSLFVITLFVGSNQILFQGNYTHTLPFISALLFGGIIGRARLHWQKMLILASGMWANFLDLLFSPLLYFGIVAFAYLAPKLNLGVVKSIRSFFTCVAFWFFGYFGTWIIRFAYAEYAGQSGESKNAIESAKLRTNGVAFNDSDPSLLFPFKENLDQYFSQSFNQLVFWSGITLLALYLVVSLYDQSKVAPALFFYISLSLILTITWYAVMRNHSLVHSWFTFRSISVLPAIAIALTIPSFVGLLKRK